jgi:predicted nuclease of restriction endonuclease-like (RecB) superfamily
MKSNNSQTLFSAISKFIESARKNVVKTVNSELVMLYWNIGNAIRNEILNNKRADYGKKIVQQLSKQLTEKYGKGYTISGLMQFIKFVEMFSDNSIVYTLCTQFTWSHIRIIIYIKDDLKRDFYIEMCKMERWSVRILRKKIDTMLFERTAVSKKPDKLLKEEIKNINKSDPLNPDIVFKEPYILDFLGLKDTYNEKDVESAILQELQNFIIELGTDFAFLARQKRITVDHDDYYIDLLFYHRKMKRLVVIELKMGKFKPAHKGQMELYLNWLKKYETYEGENSPIGLILCAEKSSEHVELLMLEDSNIKVAQYLTELPSKKLLEEKLHNAVINAKERMLNKN